MPETKRRPPGLDRPSTIRIIKTMTAVNTWVYRRTGGRLGSTWHVGSALRKGVPVCLVTTRGRKTGEPRTVALLYMRDGDRLIFVASQGGLPKNPMWYLNLKADPNVTVQIGRHEQKMHARTADAAERAHYWPKLLELYADFAHYQTWTDRVIPVVICEALKSEAPS